MSDDYEFRVSVMDQIKKLRDHIDELYKLVQNIELKEEANEFSECGCPSHRDQNGIVTVNPNKNPKDNTL